MKIATVMVGALAMVGAGVWADADVNLSGAYTTDQTITATSDTTVNLNGVTFTDCTLTLSGNVTFTLNLQDGTENVFELANNNSALVCEDKALVITGGGSLELTSTKRIKNSGVLVCKDLTVAGGDTVVTFDNDKSDTSCVFLTGNYRQTGGKLKVDMHKKNCTNEFYGVKFDTKNTSFTLEGGKFHAEIAGTKSRAIDLKKTCSAYFKGGEGEAEFEGPEGRFVSGGTVVFDDGEFTFTTNITSKMTAAYYPTSVRAVKSDYSITVNGGDFEADLPLAGSEVFETDSDIGTTIEIAGGEFDLLAGNDCLNAHTDIKISGGLVRGRSIYDDVLDANGCVYISGGTVRAYATAVDTHGIDVNSTASASNKLVLSGGNVVATEGPSTEKIAVEGTQAYFYGAVAANDYSGKYLVVSGTEDGAAIVTKVCLPALTAGATVRILVSVPGMSTDQPTPLTAAAAYADASSSVPLVFERKAQVEGNTITTREGDTIELASYYDIVPASGKSKTFTLTLNSLAKPVFAVVADDGVAGIEVGADTVAVRVRSLAGLNYQLQTAAECASTMSWTNVGALQAGSGDIITWTVPLAASAAFYQVVAND